MTAFTAIFFVIWPLFAFSCTTRMQAGNVHEGNSNMEESERDIELGNYQQHKDLNLTEGLLLDVVWV